MSFEDENEDNDVIFLEDTDIKKKRKNEARKNIF